jgi:hypothetical protein
MAVVVGRKIIAIGTLNLAEQALDELTSRTHRAQSTNVMGK